MRGSVLDGGGVGRDAPASTALFEALAGAGGLIERVSRLLELRFDVPVEGGAALMVGPSEEAGAAAAAAP